MSSLLGPLAAISSISFITISRSSSAISSFVSNEMVMLVSLVGDVLVEPGTCTPYVPPFSSRIETR